MFGVPEPVKLVVGAVRCYRTTMRGIRDPDLWQYKATLDRMCGVSSGPTVVAFRHGRRVFEIHSYDPAAWDDRAA